MLKWLRSVDWLAINTSALVLVVSMWASVLLPSPHANQATYHATDQKQDNLILGITAEGWTAIFTGLLTFSTIGLWLVTRDASNAAKAAGEALPKMERAYVFFNSLTCAQLGEPGDIVLLIWKQNPTKTANFRLLYGFKNHGRTPAIVTSLNVYARFVAGEISEKVVGDPLPMPLVVSGGESPPESSFNCVVTGAEYQEARAGHGYIFFWGKIAYLDVFEAQHETGICAHWHFGEARFVISETKELNYYT